MLPHPFPQLPITTLPSVPPFASGVIEFFVFTLGTSLLYTLLHYVLPSSISTTPSPEGLSEPDHNFDPGPPTSTVTTEPPYIGTMVIGREQNEASRKYIFWGMLDVIEENVGLSDEQDEQTFALSIDLTSGYVDIDEAHSLLDTILRDWLGNCLSRLEKLEILLPPNIKRDKMKIEPLSLPLSKLTHFTWKGNAADMPLPFHHLAYLPLQQLTHINLQTALSLTDAILILHNCFEIEQAEFHGLSNAPPTLNLRTRPLRVLRFLDTLKITSTISLQPLFETFDFRFLRILFLEVITEIPDHLSLDSLSWETRMESVELRGNFSNNMIRKMAATLITFEVRFIYNKQ